MLVPATGEGGSSCIDARLHRRPRSAAAAKPRLGVVAKRFINEGRCPGPRYLAAGPEITTVGGLGDAAPSHIPHEGLNLGLVVSGPEGGAPRRPHTLIKYGVDSIKLNLSGEEPTGMGAEETPMSERRRWRWPSPRRAAAARWCRRMPARPARSSSASGTASRTSTTPRSPTRRRSSMLEAAEGPPLRAGAGHRLADRLPPARPPSGASNQAPCLAIACEARARDVHRDDEEDAPPRRPRICIGGDYGFAWTPQGTSARDIQTFVEMLGLRRRWRRSRRRPSTAARSCA